MTRTSSGWTPLVAATGAFIALALQTGAAVPKFFPDDPLAREVDNQDASTVRPADVSRMWSGWQAIRHRSDRRAIGSVNVNTMNEVSDSNWFTNRIGGKPLSVDTIVRGPDTLSSPLSGPWTVVAGKTDGVTPGLQLKDGLGRRFFVKFDPPGHDELASGAEVIATKLLFAIGYWVPENYIGTLRRDTLTLAPDATYRGADGQKRRMTAADVDQVLSRAARKSDGSYRILASLAVEGRPIGPFLYVGVRSDDPNDIVPHEHRRELRALGVFAAWLNHVDVKSQNTLDTLVHADGRMVVRHYLLDFGSTLGSGATGPKEWREGYEYATDQRTSLRAFATFGAHTPPWLRIRYPDLPGVGRIESEHFQPERWKPTLPNPAFLNARADDTFWAAQRVMAFSDDAIRAVVASAAFSDTQASQYLSRVLIERRDAIGRAWLTHLNPITKPTVDPEGYFSFRNAAADASLVDGRSRYQIRWSVFDNATHEATPLGSWSTVSEPRCAIPDVPLDSRFILAEVRTIHPAHPAWAHLVRAFFTRTGSQSWRPIGFESPSM